jgi:hypothetical protein
MEMLQLGDFYMTAKFTRPFTIGVVPVSVCERKAQLLKPGS